MTHKNSTVCVAAVLLLFAIFNSKARAGHDAEGERDSHALATHRTTTPVASDSPASPLPGALLAKPADDEVSDLPIESPNASIITSTNYIVIGSEIYTSLQSVNATSGMPAPSTPGKAIDAASAANLARQAIDLLMFAIAGKPAALEADVHTIACNAGGTVDADASLRQAGQISPGDRIVLSLSNCQLASDARPAAGTVDFIFNRIDGAVSEDRPWHAAVDVQFHELAMVFAPDAVVGNGQMSMEISQSGPGERIVSVCSDRLSEEAKSWSATALHFAPTARTYRAYKAVWTDAGMRSAWDVSYALTTRNGYFYTSEFVVSTMQPMVFDGGKYPISGEVKVTGKKSSMTLPVLEGDMVRLDFSEKGDDLINQTTFLPASKLLAAVE